MAMTRPVHHVLFPTLPTHAYDTRMTYNVFLRLFDYALTASIHKRSGNTSSKGAHVTYICDLGSFSKVIGLYVPLSGGKVPFSENQGQ
jgi:hypothetical protein